MAMEGITSMKNLKTIHHGVLPNTAGIFNHLLTTIFSNPLEIIAKYQKKFIIFMRK